MGLGNFPPENNYLLEIVITELFQSKTERQQYWLHAVKAARITGKQVLKLSSGTISSWKEIIKDGKFTNLPTHNPHTNNPTAPEIDEPPAKATQNPHISR